MDERIARINKAAEYISSVISSRNPKVAIVLGSGLGNLANQIQDSIVIPYKDIPGFPVSTAIGHKGNFISGTLGGKQVLAMQGRFHYYEGYPMDTVTIGIRVMKRLGIEYLLVSNAAGGCNPNYKVGDLVIIKDHISFMPNPLIGPNMEEFGQRFTDLTCAYDLELQSIARCVATEMGLSLKNGVYLGSTGPSYETPAEVRFYKAVGADLLGMSTVPEVIVARHCGMRVFGMSVVTNLSNTTNEANILNDGDDVVEQANNAAKEMSELFSGIIQKLTI